MIEQVSVQAEPSVLVICINYCNEQDTQSFTRDVLRQECSKSVQLIVVDNSERETPSCLLSSLPQTDSRVSLLYPGRNLGYFGAADWGLRQYLVKMPLPEWVIVSNTDISLVGHDFFDRLFKLYPSNSDSSSVVLAPSIRSTYSGAEQNPYMIRRPSRARMRFYKYIFSNNLLCISYHILSMLKRKVLMLGNGFSQSGSKRKKKSQIEPRSIYASHGSFMIFNKKYFETGGTLKHGAFLFGEEIFVAETVRSLGFKVVYDPRLSVLHREHATTSILKSHKMQVYLRKASDYCLNQFFM